MHLTTTLMIAFLATGLLAPAGALAKGEVYRWVDSDGVVHFDDRKPARGKAELVHIQPGKLTNPQTPVDPVLEADPQTPTGLDETAKPLPAAAEPSYADKKREQRAMRRQAAAEKQQARDANCARAQQLVAQLEPSPRVIVEQKDGSVARLDDNQRMDMLNDARDYISVNCDNNR